jgi:streptogramin lyase
MVVVPAVLAIGSLAVPGNAVTHHHHHHGPKAPPVGTIWSAEPGGRSGGTVLAFAPKAHGNAKPLIKIHGSKTAFDEPTTVAPSKDGGVWVGGINDPIVRFAPGAHGNVKPIQTIDGPNTHLSEPTGIAVTADGSIWVADEDSGLLHFAKHANGDVAPLQDITGASTGVSIARSIALTPDGQHVWDVDEFALLEFPVTANGDVAPENTITGADTKISDGPYGSTGPGITVGVDGSLYVSSGSGMLRFAPGATGDAIPTVVNSAKAGLKYPYQISLAANGHLWVGSEGNNSIVELPAVASGKTKQLRRIHGAATKLKHPWGAAVYGYRPGKVTKVAVAVHHKKTTLTWKQPKRTGGGLVYYVVQRRLDGGDWTTVHGGASRTFTDGKSAVGTSRSYRVAAANGIGWGDFHGLNVPAKAPKPKRRSET